ncbi:Uncharacterized protein NCS13_1_1948 [Neochlamydia sp. S13]|nr:Uncharacterized protein NCS13_1_1948 [Neochlamydia sp. S13]
MLRAQPTYPFSAEIELATELFELKLIRNLLKNILGEIWQHFPSAAKKVCILFPTSFKKKQALRFKEEAKPSLTIFPNLRL